MAPAEREDGEGQAVVLAVGHRGGGRCQQTMSSDADNRSSAVATPDGDVHPSASRRRNDAQASRHALLEAAAALFDERGYRARPSATSVSAQASTPR